MGVGRGGSSRFEQGARGGKHPLPSPGPPAPPQTLIVSTTHPVHLHPRMDPGPQPPLSPTGPALSPSIVTHVRHGPTLPTPGPSDSQCVQVLPPSRPRRREALQNEGTLDQRVDWEVRNRTECTVPSIGGLVRRPLLLPSALTPSFFRSPPDVRPDPGGGRRWYL